MKIANIFSINKIDVPQDFNVVSSFDDIIEGLPTLIIGYEYVNKHYPDFDITNIRLGDNLYWTFKKTEKRDKYEEDLKWFITKSYVDLVNQISYIFVDPIQYRGRKLIKIVKKIYSLKNIVTYTNDTMIYIYAENLIFGIDLRLMKYIGFDVDRLKAKIKGITYIFLEESDIFIEYKNIIFFLGKQNRYLPYLYSIRNGQNNTSSLVYLSREG